MLFADLLLVVRTLKIAIPNLKNKDIKGVLIPEKLIARNDLCLLLSGH